MGYEVDRLLSKTHMKSIPEQCLQHKCAVHIKKPSFEQFRLKGAVLQKINLYFLTLMSFDSHTVFTFTILADAFIQIDSHSQEYTAVRKNKETISKFFQVFQNLLFISLVKNRAVKRLVVIMCLVVIAVG